MLIYSAKWSFSDTFWQIMMQNVFSLFIPSWNVFSFRTQSWSGGPSLDAPTWHWNQLTSQPHQHLTTMMSSHCRNKIQFKTASPQPRWLAFSIFKYIHVSQALNKASFQYFLYIHVSQALNKASFQYYPSLPSLNHVWDRFLGLSHNHLSHSKSQPQLQCFFANYQLIKENCLY